MMDRGGAEAGSELVETFRGWLVRLPKDAVLLSSTLGDETLSREGRIALASGLNYLFKSLDLIDDGIAGLGFLDDAFVLRLMTARVQGAPEPLAELGREALVVREFLGDLVPRFERYLETLPAARVRGRSSAEIVDDPEKADEFLREVRSFSDRYECPEMPSEATALVQLRSFLGAKLPA